MSESAQAQALAFVLEGYLIPTEEWGRAPENVQKMVEGEQGPIGIAHHPDHGWAVVVAGQGPIVVWCERPPEGLESLSG